METELLNKIYEELDFIKKRVLVIDNEIEDISNALHIVRPEYIEKLKKIKRGKFHSFKTKEEFLRFIENGI